MYNYFDEILLRETVYKGVEKNLERFCGFWYLTTGMERIGKEFFGNGL